MEEIVLAAARLAVKSIVIRVLNKLDLISSLRLWFI